MPPASLAGRPQYQLASHAVSCLSPVLFGDLRQVTGTVNYQRIRLLLSGNAPTRRQVTGDCQLPTRQIAPVL